MSVDHYENFPVASVLLPARLRRPIEIIYHFARTADDFADEGDAPASLRHAQLKAYRDELQRIAAGHTPQTPLFIDLGQVIAAYQLPLTLFYDLLDAFSQDIEQNRYADYPSLLDYCRRSANPVGRLVLALFGQHTPTQVAQSDAICTALQLTNFWQDIAIDWHKNRVYLPQDELQRFGLDEQAIAQGQASSAWCALMDFQIERTRQLMLRGAPLVHTLPGRLGWEIRFTIQGGLRILERLQHIRGNIWHQRPRLSWRDGFTLTRRALWM